MCIIVVLEPITIVLHVKKTWHDDNIIVTCTVVDILKYVLWAQSDFFVDFCVWFFNVFLVTATLLFCLNHCSLFLVTISSVKIIVNNHFPLELFRLSDNHNLFASSSKQHNIFPKWKKGERKFLALVSIWFIQCTKIWFAFFKAKDIPKLIFMELFWDFLRWQ